MKSHIRVSTCFLEFIALTRSCIGIISWVSQFLHLQKPCWKLLSTLWSSRCFQMWWHIICSSVLDVTEVRDSGLSLFAKDLFPFFKIGTTLALIPSFGNWPWSNDYWKVKPECQCLWLSSLRVYVGTSSGPLALFKLRDSRSFWTPIVMSLLFDSNLGVID